MGITEVVAADGRRWTVRRRVRWPRWRGKDIGWDDGDLIWFVDGDWGLPVAGILLGVLLVIVVGLAIVVLLPLLLFIGELAFVLAGVALLRGTWVVEAKTGGPPPASKAWKVRGWARSKRALEEVASELRAGFEAAPTKAESV